MTRTTLRNRKSSGKSVRSTSVSSINAIKRLFLCIEKSLALIERIEKEEAERESDSSESSEEEEDDEQKWDCQTILTTHTNTDNHPAIVKTQGRVVRTKQRIELHK